MKTTDRPRFPARPALLIALVVALLVALPTTAGAGSVKPSVGDYAAYVKVPAFPRVVYEQGAFAVTNDAGKRRIVSTEAIQGIFYPDIGKCYSSHLPLTAESIPISKAGKFSISDVTPVKKGSVTVLWKGQWTSPRKVKGTLKISHQKCTSKFDWVGSRSVPIG